MYNGALTCINLPERLSTTQHSHGSQKYCSKETALCSGVDIGVCQMPSASAGHKKDYGCTKADYYCQASMNNDLTLSSSLYNSIDAYKHNVCARPFHHFSFSDFYYLNSGLSKNTTHMSYEELQSEKNFTNQNSRAFNHSSQSSYISSHNVQGSYFPNGGDGLMHFYDTTRTVFPVETPQSVAHDDMLASKLRHCPYHNLEDFLSSAVSSEMILNALILKLIGCRATTVWINKLKSVVSFLPRTLLLGYILILRLTNSTLLELSDGIPQVYLACCITASKSQYDSRVSNISFVSEDMNVQKINYLEGLVLNYLKYEIGISSDDIWNAVEEIGRINMPKVDATLIYY